MALSPILIFLSLCIIISQEASVNRGSFGDVKPVTFMGFNNNLGTYVEYKGQVGINLGQHFRRVVLDMEPIYIFQELFYSGCKALVKYGSLLEWPEMHSVRNINELLNTFHQLSTINETTKFWHYRITWDISFDALRNQIKLFSGTYKVYSSNITVMFANLRHLASEMEREANIILTEIKCDQLNTTSLCDKRVFSDIVRHFNFTKSGLIESATKKARKLDNKTLAFDYKIPMIDNEQFSIYRLTPIPKVHQSGTIEILDIDAPYIAINNMTERYFRLHDLEHCITLENKRFVCKPPTIFEIKHTENLPCDVAAVLNQSSAVCASHLDERQSLLTPLLAPNSWMATVTKETSLLALCSADDYELKLKINGSGILRIRDDCTVRLGTSVLRGQHKEWRDNNLAYASLQTKTETPTVELFQSHVDQVIRDSVMKLKEQIEPGTIEYPYVIGVGVLLIICLFMALLYCHLRSQLRNGVELNDAHQQLRVHFRSRSEKRDTTEG